MPKAGDEALRRCLPSTASGHGFTMLELLIVISLIAILTSITFVIGRSVIERSRIAQAKAEMAVLAAALEQYKQQYGDYPCTPTGLPAGVSDPKWDGGAVLFNALCGNLGPKADKALTVKGRTFVDLGRFALWSTAEDDLPLATATDLRVNWFDDPWGKWYYYRYKQDPADMTWKSKGFLLYSHGPDEACNLGDDEDVSMPYRTGLLEDFPAGSDEINRDNIYYGRE